MDSVRRFLGFMRLDRVPNAWIRELCGMRKGLDKRIHHSGVWRGWRGIGSPRESM